MRRRWFRTVVLALVTSVSVVSVDLAGPVPAAEARHCTFNTANSVRRVDTTRRLVALTFDDGPSTVLTPRVLAALAKRDVKATFFVLGQAVKRRPALARMIVDQGHQIANHSYTHVFGQPKTVIKELAPTNAAILAATGVQPTVFRAPGGCLSAGLDAAAMAMGMRPIQWSTHSDDSTWPRPRAATMCRSILRNDKPGAIIVFHDNGGLTGRGNHKSTLDALPCIIDGFRAKGYEMVTVSELLAAAGT